MANETDEKERPMNDAGQDSDQGAAAQVRISLVVPTFGRSDVLARLVTSMASQTNRSFELIIVDQNEDDRVVPHVEAARAAGLEVNHVRRRQCGVAAARNAGAEHARAEILSFPDDDCWYEPDVVARALAEFEREPSLSGLVGHWVEEDPARARPAETLALARWRRFKVGSAPGFALFLRKSVWHEVGGFAENLGVGCYFGSAEEEDLIFRLLGRGARIDYAPTVDIHHLHLDAPALTPLLKRRSRSYGRGTGAVLAKHRLPMWVVARGLVGPFVRALKAPNRGSALVLGAYTTLGRVEGLVGWWALEYRSGGQPRNPAARG